MLEAGDPSVNETRRFWAYVEQRLEFGRSKLD